MKWCAPRRERAREGSGPVRSSSHPTRPRPRWRRGKSRPKANRRRSGHPASEPRPLDPVSCVELAGVRADGALGVGFLSWYYARALARPAHAHEAAQAAAKSRAQGEMALPSLGRIEVPRLTRSDPEPSPETGPSVFERTLGPQPAPPTHCRGHRSGDTPASQPVWLICRGLNQDPCEVAFERQSGRSGVCQELRTLEGGVAERQEDPVFRRVAATLRRRRRGDPLQALLKPTLTPAVAPSVLPTQGSCFPRAPSSIARWRPRSIRRFRA